MYVISATEFKAKCLQLLDRVATTGERITVTKRGKVVAELGPPETSHSLPAGPGFAKGRFKITGDIVTPLDVEWDAMQ